MTAQSPRGFCDRAPVAGCYLAWVPIKRALGLVEKALEMLKMEGLNTPHDHGTIHRDAFQIADRAFDVDKRRFHLKKATSAGFRQTGRDLG